MSESKVVLALRLPDQVAIKYALPNGVPQEEVSIPLLSVDVAQMDRTERRVLTAGLRAFCAESFPLMGKYPVASDCVDGEVTLSAEITDLPRVQRRTG